MFSLPSGVK